MSWIVVIKRTAEWGASWILVIKRTTAEWGAIGWENSKVGYQQNQITPIGIEKNPLCGIDRVCYDKIDWLLIDVADNIDEPDVLIDNLHS